MEVKMLSRDFAYWLQGFFEIHAAGRDLSEHAPGLTASQVATIRNHLNMVFVHEIDPSMGGHQKQQALNTAHQGNAIGGPMGNGLVARC
jgi:hypothetical protein